MLAKNQLLQNNIRNNFISFYLMTYQNNRFIFKFIKMLFSNFFFLYIYNILL